MGGETIERKRSFGKMWQCTLQFIILSSPFQAYIRNLIWEVNNKKDESEEILKPDKKIKIEVAKPKGHEKITQAPKQVEYDLPASLDNKCW